MQTRALSFSFLVLFHIDLAVTVGQTYFYAVTAVNASDQEGDASAEIRATIPTP